MADNKPEPVSNTFYLTTTAAPETQWVWDQNATGGNFPFTVTIPVAVEAPEAEGKEWEGVLAVEGLPTTDGRYLMPGKIGHRDLPLSLMMQKATADGHDGAVIAGKITEVRREQRPDLGEQAVAIIGKGVFANTEEGEEAAQLVADEVLRGVSIDFAHTAAHIINSETLEIVEEGDLDLEQMLNGDFLRGFEGDIMGATLCAFPAFEDATMRILDVGDKTLIASMFSMRKVLTASAAGIAPMQPPYDWFFTAETEGPCPLTVTDDGRVYGHLALWGQCHRSYGRGVCEMAPRSPSGYAYFHTGSLTCDDGRKVNIGRITVGDGGHAPTDPRLGIAGAIDHYDKTGLVAAFVRAVDGRYGIWLSGCVRSDCPAEKVRDMEANPPSGDWREEKGRLELCAALSVPVAGFPVPRAEPQYEYAMVASGAEEHVAVLIATGYTGPHEFTRADQRKLVRLKRSARELLGIEEFDDGFREVSRAERRRLAKTGAAMPDGSFPIANCQDAKNAQQAIGRTSPGRRAAVKAHISRRERSLGCSND